MFILNVSNNTTLMTVAQFNFPAKLFLVEILRPPAHFADFSDDPLPNSISWWHLLHPSKSIFTFEPKVLLSFSVHSPGLNFPFQSTFPQMNTFAIQIKCGFTWHKVAWNPKFKLCVSKALWMKTWPVHPNYWAVGGGGGPIISICLHFAHLPTTWLDKAPGSTGNWGPKRVNIIQST